MSDSFWLWTLWLMLIAALAMAIYSVVAAKDKKG